MLTADTEIATDRGSRYLVRLCRHAASMASTKGHRLRAHAGRDASPAGEVQLVADWSDKDGVIRFAPWGRCSLQATANTLTVRIDARDESALSRIQDIITNDLQRIGRRERLIVTWRRPAASTDPPANGTGSMTPPRPTPRRRGHRLPIVVTAAVALVVAAHLGLGAVMLTNLRWTVGTAAVVLLIIAAKLLVILISRHSLRRRRAARRS